MPERAMESVVIDPPEEIKECARRMIQWAADRGLEEWSVLGVGPRYTGRVRAPPPGKGKANGELRIKDGRLWVWVTGRWQDCAP